MIAALERQINGLDRSVDKVAHRVDETVKVVNHHTDQLQEVEDEMAKTSDAVGKMHAGVVTGLVAVQQTTQNGMAEVARTSQEGFAALDTATVRGFTDTVQNLSVVDSSVQRLTQGMIQMQLISTVTDAQRPLNIIRRFGTEIDERFNKALEKVAAVRSSYDAVSATTLNAYDAKLHEIGSHIFEIYESDFKAIVESELTTHLTTHWVVPRDVQIAQGDAREAQLDSDLADLKVQHLLPLVDAERTLDVAVRNQFAVPMQSEKVEVVYVPCLVVAQNGGQRKAYCGNPIETDSQSEHGATSHIEEQRAWTKIVQQVEKQANSGNLELQAQPLRNLVELKKRLDAMVGRGELSPDRREAMDAYLQAHGLSFLAGGAQQAPA